MEEYINEIREYLPLKYQLKDNNDYIEYLINAFNKTSEVGNYQFSFLAFHLLYMSFIYKVIRQSYEQDVKNIRKMIEQLERQIASYDNPFDLSVLPEFASLGLLKCFGFHKNKLDEFQSIIRHRDHVAHASGFVQYGEEQVRRFIEDELKHIKEIQAKSSEVIYGLFENYFQKNFNLDDDSNFFPSGFESVNKFSELNLLSIKDLETLLIINPPFLNDESGNLSIIYKKVFYLLIAGYVDDNKSYETDFFINYLPKLFLGSEKQDAFDISYLFDNQLQDNLIYMPDKKLDKIKLICSEFGIGYDFDYLVNLGGMGGGGGLP